VSTHWGLLLPFDTDSHDFVRGFELGRLWWILHTDSGEVWETVHASNAEMILRIGEATGREVFSEEVGDDWLHVQFSGSDS